MALEYTPKDNKESLALNKIRYDTEETFRMYGKSEIKSLDIKKREALKKVLTTIIKTNLASIRNDHYFLKHSGKISGSIFEIWKNIDEKYGSNIGDLFIEAAEESSKENGLHVSISKSLAN